MIKIIYGRAGAGKTARIYEEIRRLTEKKKGGTVLIVPEQYSHECERELCSICGDSLSLFAEVLSFTGLARKISSELGGMNASYLDKGGRLLCMALAAKNTGGKLKSFKTAAYSPRTQNALLAAVDFLKAGCITTEKLLDASESCGGELGEKLRDLCLVSEAYDAVVSKGRADPGDALLELAEKLSRSSLGPENEFFADGFTDFTGAELQVLEALVKKGVNLTVCLTADSLREGDPVFTLSRLAAARLEEMAAEAKTEFETVFAEGGGNGFADRLFFRDSEGGKPGGAAEIYRAGSPAGECELAAAKCLELVRTTGCRWRDIAVACRGFEDYAPLLEASFERAGIPLFTTEREPISSKPLPAMITYAYDIVQGGWNSEDIAALLGTGLAPLSFEETVKLTKKLASERIRGEEKPLWLLRFEKDTKAARTAAEQAEALAELLKNMKLEKTLASKAEENPEYLQLWEIVISALEQIYSVLGDAPMNTEEFAALFNLVISKYDVGLIPVGLDRVSAGDFGKMRRRNLKHLIIIGASEDRLPRISGEEGIFTEDEKETLAALGFSGAGSGEGELWREFMLIYNCVSLPKERLIISCSGEPSFVFERAKKLFSLEEKSFEQESLNRARLKLLEKEKPGSRQELEERGKSARGRLSELGVENLYRQNMRISASKADSYFSCKFAYFCRYGLGAKEWEKEEFTAQEFGTFTHDILQHVAEEAEKRGGFRNMDNDRVEKTARERMERYVEEKLEGLKNKTDRYIWLFRRLEEDVVLIAIDTAEELRKSLFVPEEFEFDFSKPENCPPIALGEGEAAFTLSGIADRIDSYEKDGLKYYRVVDYKTGKKDFSFRDVYYGLGMQMLLYLYGLQLRDENARGAGVMYVPARNEFAKMDSPPESREEAEEQRHKELKRSGMMLADGEIAEAWEQGEEKLYSPSAGNSVNSEELELVYAHVKKKLSQMAEEIKQGRIDADPYVKGSADTACRFCPYLSICRFRDGENGESFRALESFRTKQALERIIEEVKNG